MRIAFLLRTFPVLSETFILNQITGLIDRGHEVDIYAIYPGKGLTHQAYQDYRLSDRTLYAPNVPAQPLTRIAQLFPLLMRHMADWPQLLPTLNVLRFKRQARSLYLFYLGLLFIRQPQQYDIIHCHFGLIGLIGCDLRALGFLDGRLVTSYHGMDITTYPQMHGKDIYQRLFDQGELFTANSQFTISKLHALGCPPERITKLPVGVDTSKFYYFSRTLSDQQTPYLLSVGRLVNSKGFEYSIRAVASLHRQYPQLRYRIIGEGSSREHLRLLIQDLDAENYIELMGAQPQEVVRQVYQDSHLFMLPSIVQADGYAEAQGLVLQEAQASGLPVIATQVGGIADGVLDGQSGFLVPEKDVQALADRLAYLIDHPSLWAEMGAQGRKLVEENYDLNVLSDRLEQLYREVLANGH